MEYKPQRPDSYLALAIISTLVCCMPLGIVSIIYSTKVNSAFDNGNYELAEKSSKSAKNWGIASIAIGIVGSIITIIFVVLAQAING